MGFTIERIPGTSAWAVRGEGEGHVGEADEIIIARTIEILSGFRGVEARVFTEEDEALAWLGEGRARSAQTGRQ